jgi:outer membrane autotransporter protein
MRKNTVRRRLRENLFAGGTVSAVCATLIVAPAATIASQPAFAQLLIANGTTVTASGTFNSGTTNGNAGFGLQALNGGVIQSFSPLTIITGGINAVAVQAQTGSTINIFSGSTITTSAFGGDGIVASGAGATVTATNTAITTTGDSFGVIAGAGGTVTLNNGSVTSAFDAILAENAGSKITATGTAISGGSFGAVVDGGTISLSRSTVTSAGTGIQVFSAGTATLTDTSVTTTGSSPAIALFGGSTFTMTGGSITTTGAGANALSSGSGINTATIADATVSAAQGAGINVSTGTLHATVTGSSISGGSALLNVVNGGTLNLTASASTLTGAAVTQAGSTSNLVLENGTLWHLTGDSTVTNLTNDGSSILFSPPVGGVFKTLTAVNYVGVGGTLGLNTFLGADNSPSDRSVINGGSATGSSFVHITNAGGPGAETTSNGILVVNAINGGTTAPGAFTLLSEARGGAFDYFLFRGGLNGSAPNDWFLRSDFVVGPLPPVPFPPGVLPPDVFPTDPPPQPLPPGVYPIIGPELATYGVVQPIARQLGLTTLGTLHERAGDTLEGSCGGAAPTNAVALAAKATTTPDGACKPGLWGRVFGESINNRYSAFADPRATGQIAGIQTGFDIFRGSLVPGHSDTAGIYLAYGNAHVDVDGLVTNPAATAYVINRTGTVGLNAYSGGAYWTHYGPTGWYIDAVVQGTGYDGSATTQFANLPLTGSGVATSLEAGYPVPLPWLGPSFVLEPQGQIIWQQVSFKEANDGLGPVGLGTTRGATGRLGLRGQWTITGANGMIWQPYVRANVWRDWGAEATTTFGIDQVPLIEQATRLELAGGVTAKLGASLSVFAQGGYQFATSESGPNGFRRDSVKGDVGVRYTW